MAEQPHSDRTLTGITDRVSAVVADTRKLYDLIRAAKELGYSYNELEQATGFPRGTVQNIVSGRNPRLTVEN
ncbi:hypothetical protein [Mycobacterium sp. DL592]|uniref:hypothetical protein n=1 Tax=Mycobacterium sp. DL592 TaxID=2675524 RepID=UPI00141EE076|nr:hypothetical protein [Mycobacterium sp. DL592]